jgi:C4-dicarboxylate-specific signal transduction histidine kinase
VRVAVETGPTGPATVVEDGGPGVAPDLVPRIFEPFFTTKIDGTGLGLAVSRALATASGCRLEYRRDAGKTRFELAMSAGGAQA